ncbi:MAG TPA: hypothetical protein VF682_16010 [Pseudomonas sp.]|jgi:hypothetical protein
MSMPEAISTGALALMVVILLVLLYQSLRLDDLLKMTLACRKDARWLRICEVENRELRSALRAEKAQIEQLQRKVVILQQLLPVEVKEGL